MAPNRKLCTDNEASWPGNFDIQECVVVDKSSSTLFYMLTILVLFMRMISQIHTPITAPTTRERAPTEKK